MTNLNPYVQNKKTQADKCIYRKKVDMLWLCVAYHLYGDHTSEHRSEGPQQQQRDTIRPALSAA
jgi:hypothetical protein